MKEGLLFALSRRVSRKGLRILAYHGLWTTPGISTAIIYSCGRNNSSGG